MNKFLIILMIILALGCKFEPKNVSNELEFEEHTTDLILDTLVFDKNMIGKELAKKYAYGLSELQFYNQFVSESKILDTLILQEEHSKTEIIYLGKLKDLNNQNFYHVITNFKIIGIGEMQSPRGRSHVAFLSDNLEKAIIYQMGIPDKLPVKIENKILYFFHENEKIGISIFGGLPPLLCVPKIGCY